MSIGAPHHHQASTNLADQCMYMNNPVQAPPYSAHSTMPFRSPPSPQGEAPRKGRAKPKKPLTIECYLPREHEKDGDAVGQDTQPMPKYRFTSTFRSLYSPPHIPSPVDTEFPGNCRS